MERKGVTLDWATKKDILERISATRSLNLPFQVVETVNETRATREAKKTHGLQKTLYDIWSNGGETYASGWKNKLIWGDNKYVMSSLLQKYEGKIDLIYIDPPFATGADFSFTITIDDDTSMVKEPTAVEQKAYRDTWGKGFESYLQVMYERLDLMNRLLAHDGAIYVHMDYHIGHYVKVIMDEIFGRDNFRNEILVKRIRKNVNEYETAKKLNVATDMILFYAKSEAHRIVPPTKKERREERWHAFDAPGLRTGMDYPLFGRKPPSGRHWMWDKDRAKEAIDKGDIRPNPRTGRPEYRVAASDETLLTTMWDDVSAYSFKYSYPTEKSEQLLERIISMSGKPGGLVADFFCGSGTTLAVAERNGMRWIGCDLGRFAIHTTRKRLMELENCRPFEILNLGKYERQIWQQSSFAKGNETVLYEYLAFILRLYGAEPIAGFQHIHGRRGKVLIHIGAIDAPVTIDEVSSAMIECIAAKQTELHVLGWEWQMGIHDLIEKEARAAGIKLRLLTIPNEVMETNAVQKGDIIFFDLAYVKGEVIKNGRTVQIELSDFVIPNTDLIPDEIRNKISRWSDFIDYWAVDFDFRNDTFMNTWTAYRTKDNPKLAIKSDSYTYQNHGKYRIVVKVVDIFGIDTSQAFEVSV